VKYFEGRFILGNHYLKIGFNMSVESEYAVKPIYQKIAIDIANRIITGDLSVGDRLYGRSSLSSHYNVSPETIRKAIILLNDMDIVEVAKGSGITIKSVDNCLKFIKKFRNMDFLNLSKKEILDLFKKKNELEKEIRKKINEFTDYSNRFINSNPFMPFEFKVYKGLEIVGKTISESRFWQNTNATIIGIRRGRDLILSPGPYAVFKENDILLTIGEESSYCKVRKFLYGDDK
jgi:K+/H+ antiporter YhaU regulatory subunit KhtT